MSLNNVIIMTNRGKDAQLSLTGRIRDYLTRARVGCRVLADEQELAPYLAEGRVDALIVLGGDGTMLRAASAASAAQVPVLGVNLGMMGYLAEVEPDGAIAAMDRLLSGEYTLERRMMLAVDGTCDGGETTFEGLHALNDVSLTRRGVLKVLPFLIRINGRIACGYDADGMILSTPTGSTGYNMSAGGPVVEPSARLFVLTPICPHTLGSRSVVLRPEDEVEIALGARQEAGPQQADLNLDGSSAGILKTGDRILVRRSHREVTLIKMDGPDFMERLSRKM